MPGQFTDRELTCVECNASFTFSADEQERHAELGFQNDPKRCHPCRATRKQNRPGGNDRGGRGPREFHEAVCAECGATTKVPFKPTGRRPVYCSRCFETKRQ